MDKGVKGFRFDVVNLISKEAFEDDDGGRRTQVLHRRSEHPQILKELNEATFGTDAEIVTVGEMSSTSIENCYQYAGRDTARALHGVQFPSPESGLYGK